MPAHCPPLQAATGVEPVSPIRSPRRTPRISIGHMHRLDVQNGKRSVAPVGTHLGAIGYWLRGAKLLPSVVLFDGWSGISTGATRSSLAGPAREGDIAGAVAEVLVEDVGEVRRRGEPHRAARPWSGRSVAAVIDSTQWARCRRRDRMYRGMDVPSTAKTRDRCRSLIPIAAATCPALNLGSVRWSSTLEHAAARCAVAGSAARRPARTAVRSSTVPPQLYGALLFAWHGWRSWPGPARTDCSSCRRGRTP